MEGPNISHLPRPSFSCPVEINMRGRCVHPDFVQGTLSVRGAFLSGELLPVDGVVHLTLSGGDGLEADGIVRRCDARGAGIEFRGWREEQRRLIHEVIAEFTPGEMLAR